MLAACLLLVTEWHCCHCILILYSKIDVSGFPLVCCTEILCLVITLCWDYVEGYSTEFVGRLYMTVDI